MLGNGYWMLSNLQIFKNMFNAKNQTTDVAVSGHDFDSIYSVNQATPVLLLWMAIFIIFILQVFAKKYLKQWGFAFSSGKIEVDENLPNFFNAIKLAQADWMVNENQYYTENYKMSFISKELQDKLDDTAFAKKPI